MAYAGSWQRLHPSGAWSVWDDRLYDMGSTHTMTYYGYTKREAQAAHAAHIRNLKQNRK